MSSSTSSAKSQAAAEVERLTARREDIEAEIEGHRGRLEAEGVTMTSSLLTADGFPRDDIDVLAVRQARIRLLELRNDYKSIMAQIEAALQVALAASTERPTGSSSAAMDVDGSSVAPSRPPFAVVQTVDPKGPGATAGLQAADQITSFGSIDSTNHDGLKALAGLVGASEGKVIRIQVLRDGRSVELVLTPRGGWGGRGLLGTHILPL